MKFPGFIGPAYTLDSTNVDHQRCVNLLPESIQSGNGKAGQTVYYANTPGLEKIGQGDSAPVRKVWEDERGRALAVIGANIYRISKESDWYLDFRTLRQSVITIPIGGFDAGTDIVTLSSAGSDDFQTGSRVVFATGSGMAGSGIIALTEYYLIKLSTTTFQFAATIADAEAGTPVVDILATNTGVLSMGLCDLDLGVTGGVAFFQKYSNPEEISYDNHINFSTNTITKTAHELYTGEPIVFSTYGHPLPVGLSADTLYYAINVDADNFRVASSLTNALAATAIDISAPTPSNGDWNLTKMSNFHQFDGFSTSGSQAESFLALDTSTGPVEVSTQKAFQTVVQTYILTGSGDTTTRDAYVTYILDGTANKWFYDYNPLLERLTDDEKRTTNPFGLIAQLGVPSALGDGGVSSHGAWIDGYTILNYIGTDDFYVTRLNSLLSTFLGFASSEGSSDDILALAAHKRNLYVFNEKTIEIFVNTGNADFPFERVQGGFIEVGIKAAHSLRQLNDFLFWLGTNKYGEGIVFTMSGVQPQRISTHAIERAISSYADISSATAYTYQKNGHSFYVLNFAEATWVYDMSTGLWHERAYTNTGSGALERHRVESASFISTYGAHIGGDYSNGKIYLFNDEYYTDDTDPITRMRVTPYLSGDNNQRYFCARFQLDMEVGIGLASGQGSTPTVMMDFSDDGGHTYSSESWAFAEASSGQIGQYETRVIWRRLGYFRQRIFRVKMTDPVKCNFITAYLDLEPGAH